MKNYVKDHEGHKVPEEATHYNSANMLWPECFINVNSGEVYRLDGGPRMWVLSQRVMPTTAIELPEDPVTSKAEWTPTGRCIHVYITSSIGGVDKVEEEEVNIIGLDKLGNYVFQNDKSTCYYSDPASEFRPLKTEGEKKREAFIEDLVKVLNSVPNGTSLSDLHAMAEKAYDAGYTPPEMGV